MTTRKYMSEAGLHVMGSGILLLQQGDFHVLERPEYKAHLEKYPSHIYMITRRPRVTVEPSTFTSSPSHIAGEFCIKDESGIYKFPFCLENLLGEGSVASVPYPHQLLLAHDSEGKQIASQRASLLATKYLQDSVRDRLALEVLYVGQAYGEEGSRTSVDRLQKHETLQAIYAKAISETPDSEIWIILWSFSPQTLLSFDGREKHFLATDEEDDKHLQDVLNAEVTDQQIINLTEAAMIRYFRPEYNIRFKDTFPSPAHSTYSQCYDLDLNAIILEAEVEDFRVDLWSHSAQKSSHHIASFPLHSQEERRSMFDLLLPIDLGGGLVSMDPSMAPSL